MALSDSASAALESLGRLLDSEAAAPPGKAHRALELMTMDEEGFPFPALVSARQLLVDEQEVLVLLRGRRPTRHLASTGKATLSFVHEGAYATLRLTAVASWLAPGAAGVVWRLAVFSGSLDGRADELEAISYVAPGIDLAEGPPLSELARDRGDSFKASRGDPG